MQVEKKERTLATASLIFFQALTTYIVEETIKFCGFFRSETVRLRKYAYHYTNR